MAKTMKPASTLSHVLHQVGYLGCWEIDYSQGRVRADGEVGPVFGVARDKMMQGVALDSLDAGYQPDDLDMMKRTRRGLIGVGGHTRLQYMLRHIETEQNLMVESMAFVTLDRDGRLSRASGTLFDISALHETPSVPLPPPELDQLARRLIEAGRIARSLNLTKIESGLRPALSNVGRLLAKAASRRNLYH